MIVILFGLVILCRVLQPIFLSVLVSAILKGEESKWIMLGGAYAALFCLASVFQEIKTASYAFFEKNMNKSLSVHLIEEFLKINFMEVKQKPASEHAIIVDRGVQGIQAVFYHGMFAVLPIIVETILALGIIAFRVQIEIGVSCAILIILFAVVTYQISQKVYAKESIFFKTSTNNFSMLAESFSFFELIRSFRIVKWISNNYDSANQQFIGEVMASVKPRVLGSYVQGLLLLLLMSLVTVMVVFAEGENHQRVAELILVNGLLLQISSPLLRFSDTFRFFLQGISSSEQLFELMSLPKTSTKVSFLPLQSHDVSYRFEGFFVAYPHHPLCFRDFELPQFALLAIMGPSGSGKTSLGKVMAGVLEFSGRVRSSYHENHVTYQPQHVEIFDTTFTDNICLGKSCSPEKFRSVVNAAGFRAHELKRLEGRTLGENGSHISGGQKKRVGIARMLLADSRVMIFDEPTAELDEETVDGLMELLKQLSQQYAIVVITHSKKVASQCEKIFFIEDVIREAE